jgi:hypothetical protein
MTSPRAQQVSRRQECMGSSAGKRSSATWRLRAMGGEKLRTRYDS